MSNDNLDFKKTARTKTAVAAISVRTKAKTTRSERASTTPNRAIKTLSAILATKPKAWQEGFETGYKTAQLYR